MANDFECAAFAFDVYREENRPALPEGWELYMDYEPTSCEDAYFGAFYIKKQQDSSGNIQLQDIVFAHRGTIIKTEDIIADLEMLLTRAPTEYKKAQAFYEVVLAKLILEFPTQEDMIPFMINQTGHSLGALLAELTYIATLPPDGEVVSREVSFESTGSAPIMEKMIKEKLLREDALVLARNRCRLIFTHVDIINTCQKQVADLVFQADIPYDYTVLGGPRLTVPREYAENLYYIRGYSFGDQHVMEHIYHYFSQTNQLKSTQDWPFGFQRGYELYRNYKENPSYWNGYIQACWDKHPDIHAEHQNDYEQYHSYFIAHYLISEIKLPLTETLSQFGDWELVNIDADDLVAPPKKSGCVAL